MKAADLSAKDQVTVTLWRIANLFGWSVVALGGAAFLRAGFESAANVLGFGHGGDVPIHVANYFGTPRIVYLISVGIAAPVVCGLFLGTVIGSRVAKRQTATAAVLSTGMSAIAYAFATYNTSQWYFSLIAAASCLMVPVAVFSARSVSHSTLGSLPSP
jgi:hypothetical protein